MKNSIKDNSEGWFQKIFNISPMGMALVDATFHFFRTNDAFNHMMGYSEDEFKKLTFKEITHPDHLAEDSAGIEKLVKGDIPVYRTEKRYFTKDLQIIWAAVKVSVISDDQGKLQYLLAMIENITERKLAQDAFRNHEKLLIQVTDNVPAYISLVDKDLNYTFANKEYEGLFGLKKEEIIGRNVKDILGTEAYERASPYIARALNGESCDFENHLINKDGVEHYIQTIYSPYYRNDEIDGILVLVVDITERKRASNAIIRAETEYHNAMDALPEWIYVVDESLCLVMLNQSLKNELLQQGFPGDCIGMTLTTRFPFISPASLVGIGQVFLTGGIMISEEKILLNGRTYFCELSKVPVFKDEKVIKVIVVIRDRSKEKEMEILKQKSAAEKEVLLREIHHRVKNNLAIINSLLNFQMSISENPQLVPIFNDVQLRIRSIALIHEHLYHSENLDRIPLASYIQSLCLIIHSTFSAHHVNFDFQLEPMDINIEKALPVGLIINELLTNAIKYAFTPGMDCNITIVLRKNEDDICTLIVRDNGKGLPPNFSLDSTKTMGLFIINILIQQLEGKMVIEEHEGASFKLLFGIKTVKSRIQS